MQIHLYGSDGTLKYLSQPEDRLLAGRPGDEQLGEVEVPPEKSYGWRVAGTEDGESYGNGAPNPKQLERYIENGCFHAHHLPESMRYFKHANKDYNEFAVKMGYRGTTSQIVFQLYSEPMQKFRLAARGHGEIVPPDQHKARVETYFDPLPFWYPPFEGTAVDETAFPMHAITQRPMAMYHSWGSQNAWLRQIHGDNRLYIPESLAREQGIGPDDWVWVESRNGRVKAPVRIMQGVNARTVWTWNAIGKRPGAWNLAPDAGEARRGFLLNHLIDELLPERESGYRYAAADPVTGQAAWYDLRVRIRKALPEEAGETEPRFPALLPSGLGGRPRTLRYGAAFHERTGDGRGNDGKGKNG